MTTGIELGFIFQLTKLSCMEMTIFSGQNGVQLKRQNTIGCVAMCQLPILLGGDGVVQVINCRSVLCKHHLQQLRFSSSGETECSGDVWLLLWPDGIEFECYKNRTHQPSGAIGLYLSWQKGFWKSGIAASPAHFRLKTWHGVKSNSNPRQQYNTILFLLGG